MTKKRLFVTVGTTKFEKLIETVSSPNILAVLQKLGYVDVQFQTGSGDFKKVVFPGTTINYHPYFENFDEQVESSDLVISHAGAGTCLEVLRKGKPLIAVVNETLMDNHQNELAEQLQSDGYLFLSTCESLHETLRKKLDELRTYPKPDDVTFSVYLDKCMGFT